VIATRLLAVVAAVAALTACSPATHHDASPSTATQHALTRTVLAGAERHYGASIGRMPGVTLQPDVVPLTTGAQAIRSVSADGLVWTIDGHAPGADRLAVGKIMLATTHGVGRVLHLQRAGGDVSVVLGPVALTDVIRSGRFSSAAPIALDHPLYYATPGAPGATGGAPTSTGNRFAAGGHGHGFATMTSAGSAAGSAAPPLPEPTNDPQPVSSGEFRFTPLWNGDGIGVEAYADHGHGHLRAIFQLQVSRPELTFRLVIENGHVAEASVRIHGAGGIHVHLDAVELDASGSFKGTTIAIPIAMSFPITPFDLTVTQDITITPQLTGKGFVDAKGYYGLAGDLAFGIGVGSGPSVSINRVVEPMNRNTASYGIATNSFSFGWGIKASVGIGIPGFSAGAFYELMFSGAVAADVALDALHPACVTDALYLHSLYGLGYRVPPLVMRAVNLFLAVFGVPAIPASGGIVRGPNTLWSRGTSKYCPGYDH